MSGAVRAGEVYAFPLTGADAWGALQVLTVDEANADLIVAVLDWIGPHEPTLEQVRGAGPLMQDFMFWGADSWICGPANCMAKACVDLDRTFRSGDLKAAREKMIVLYRAMNILESGKFVQKVKYGCELQGLPVGITRAPLGELTAEEKAEFKAAMQPILNW